MMTDDPATTPDHEELELWTITIPRTGGSRGDGLGIQGNATHRFYLTGDEGNRLAQTLRRLNVSDARRGRPRLWRGDREVVGLLADGEERAEVTALAEELPTSTTPADPTLKGLAEHRTLLEREIRALIAKKEQLLLEDDARVQKQLQHQLQHLVEQSAKLRHAEAHMMDGFTAELERFVAARKLLGELQPRDAVAEAIREGRQLVEAAAGSTVGQLGALWVSGFSAQKLAQRLGKDVKPEQVLDAAIFNGQAFKLRCNTLRNWATTQKDPRAAAMVTAIDFVLGDVPPEALKRHIAED
ncbi:hypothetical protein OV203_44845 [Nannocystis sp. ILAH1]|uniref:hypothetical protein n=1 Tax=Nannocystis sp. ILAH1 TaxID=2996789 RepID=UPI0022714078|nr:hypothetical protein [Nannocystis sp. ILAH1]MCY0994337.1 hypothetical protein [Nannocystis sp. ILAH1]